MKLAQANSVVSSVSTQWKHLKLRIKRGLSTSNRDEAPINQRCSLKRG
jgi:hypothetical protein